MEFAQKKTKLEKLRTVLAQKLQRIEDMTVPYAPFRWTGFCLLLIIFFMRIFFAGGYYIITYGLCVHLLYLLLIMMTPLADPDTAGDDAAELPQRSGDEFKPWVPKLQEFKAWRSMMRVTLLCLFLTMFPFLDIPVYWPILVMYLILLFVSQMSVRIRHMLRHHYVPWSSGKPKYVSKSDK